MYQSRRFQLYMLLTILVMVFIFIQSALTADVSTQESNLIVLSVARLLDADVDTVSFVVRKCAHGAEFLVLGILLFLTVKEWLLKRAGRTGSAPDRLSAVGFFIAWGIGTAYAVSDEIHQLFVPGRSCELRDVLIDTAGVLIGAGVCRWVSGKRRQRLS